eukprot:12945694-Alexandrium_andersonii.AAC.2
MQLDPLQGLLGVARRVEVEASGGAEARRLTTQLAHGVAEDTGGVAEELREVVAAHSADRVEWLSDGSAAPSRYRQQ